MNLVRDGFGRRLRGAAAFDELDRLVAAEIMPGRFGAQMHSLEQAVDWCSVYRACLVERRNGQSSVR
jgi:hypothetical protein